MKRVSATAFAVVVVVALVLLFGNKIPTVAQTLGNTPRPNHSDNPTPFPTPAYPLPSMTPVPTSVAETTKYVPVEIDSPTIPISDSAPIYESASVFRNPSIEASTKDARAIITGTITQIDTPRWTTADGSRPSHPHSQRGQYEIYRPIHVQIQGQITGSITGTEAILYGFGGQVGQDTMVWTGDDLHTYAVGDRVIVFLDDPITVGTLSVRKLKDKYNIVNNNVINVFRTLPLSEMLQEIQSYLSGK